MSKCRVLWMTGTKVPKWDQCKEEEGCLSRSVLAYDLLGIEVPKIFPLCFLLQHSVIQDKLHFVEKNYIQRRQYIILQNISDNHADFMAYKQLIKNIWFQRQSLHFQRTGKTLNLITLLGAERIYSILIFSCFIGENIKAGCNPFMFSE